MTYLGLEGPGLGKHIVLIAGDEEYRSEESLPMLAQILAKHHGFRELPDEQMRHFVEYIERGKPVLCVRASAHAFDHTHLKLRANPSLNFLSSRGLVR